MPQEFRNHTDKIVYYLGAGASANSIPMVSQIGSALKKFENYIEDESSLFVDPKHLKSDEEIQRHLDFGKFCLQQSNIVKAAASIDTHAKRLWDQNELEEYKKYKCFLTIIFNFFHHFKTTGDLLVTNNIEGRYENLIRSINIRSRETNNEVFIPAQFSFVSWNYDFQLESSIALDYIENTNSFVEIRKKLYFKIENLNGSSNLDSIIDIPGKKSKRGVYDSLLNIYESLLFQGREQTLKFAWEKDRRNQYLFSDFSEVKYVVVIGYSFPSFNRDIDKAFFNMLKKDSEVENSHGPMGDKYKVKVFTQGYDFTDSVRIKRYLEQIFPLNKAPFEVIPVESPFFYVPAEYWKS